MASICSASSCIESGLASIVSSVSGSVANEISPCFVAATPRINQSEFVGKAVIKNSVKLAPRKSRGALIVARSTSSGASAQVEREPYIRGWSNISSEVVIGGCPSAPEDVEKIIKGSGATALVCLQNEESAAAIGMNWDAIKARAAQLNVVAVRIPMKEFDRVDQALALPEAVRAVASLVSMGHKVYVNCTSGKYRSPLVALGYLTFVKTLDITEAMAILQKNAPSASPYFDSWEEAKSKLSAGDSRRVAQIAHGVSEKRVRDGKPGSPADDWLVAQKLLVKENIERGVNTDVVLSQAILATKSKSPVPSNAASFELERQNATLKEHISLLKNQIEELKKQEAVETKSVQSAVQQVGDVNEEIAALRKSEAKAKEEVVAAKERLEFFYRQVSVLKEKEETARKAAKEAASKIASLTDQVKELERREKIANEASRAAAERVGVITKQLEELQKREISAKESASIASDRVRFLESQSRTPAVAAAIPAAKQSEEVASNRVQELAAQVEELIKKEEQARQTLEAANERNDFFHRQISVIKGKEEAAKAQAKAAENKVAALQRQVDDLKFRENAARAAAEKGTTNVDEYTKKIAELTESEASAKKAAQEAEARVAELSAKLNELIKRESSFTSVARSANEKVAQLSNQFNGATSKVNEAVVVNATIEAAEKIKELNNEILILTKRAIAAEDSVKMGQDRIDFFFRQAMTLKEREQKAKQEYSEKINVFKRQVSELQRKVVQAEKATEEANSRIVVLTEKVELLEASEKKLKEENDVSKDRIQFFFRQVASLREKEEATRKATDAANARIKQLLRQIDNLEKREHAASVKAERFAEQVSALLQQNSDLHQSLSTVENREAELVKALEEGSGMLTIALEADETIRRLKIEADKAAAELEAAKSHASKLAQEVETARRTAEVSYRMDVPSSGSFTDIQKELNGSTIDVTANAQGTFLRNVVVGALGLAALPVTAYSLMSGTPQPSMLAEVNFGSQVEETVLAPTLRSGQASEFCSSVPPGLRSAQTEKFCSALNEIENE